MTRFDKYAQAAIGLLFVLLLAFFGLKTASNIREESPAQWSRALIDDYYNEDFERHDDFINYNGAFRAAIGTRIMRDADPQNMVFKRDNGQLSTIMAVYDPTVPVRRTAAFCAWLEEKGIDFLYVQTPTKNSDPASSLPPGVKDYSDYCMDLFVKLADGQFPIMDLREEFAAAGFAYTDIYFDTDHHWLPRTGFWVSSQLLEYFAKRGSLESDAYYRDIANYKAESYEQLFLGSLGRRVGKYFAGLDDFEFISPAFPTDLEVSINRGSSETERSGDFMESVIYQPLLVMDEEHLWDNHYGAYFGGDYAEVRVKNNNIDGGKVLLIKDSFTLPVAAFMSCAVSELRMLDLRYLKDTDIEAYIEDYSPDAVAVIYSPSVIGAPYMYEFLNEE